MIQASLSSASSLGVSNTGQTSASAAACLDVSVPNPEGASSRGVKRIHVRSIAGNHRDLGYFELSQPLLEVRRAIRAAWNIPVSQQILLVNDGEVVFNQQEESLFDMLGQDNGNSILLHEIFGSTSTDPIVMDVIRTERSPKKQELFDYELLRAAAKASAADVKELLLEHADPDVDLPGPTPLMVGIAAGHDQIVQLLRSYGAKDPDLEPKTQSLGDALARSDIQDALRHLAKGADPNMRLSHGQGILGTHAGCPLHACCQLHEKAWWHGRGTAQLAQVLVALGADTNAADAEGDTPLAHAKLFRADAELVEVLKNEGGLLAGPYYRPLRKESSLEDPKDAGNSKPAGSEHSQHLPVHDSKYKSNSGSRSKSRSRSRSRCRPRSKSSSTFEDGEVSRH